MDNKIKVNFILITAVFFVPLFFAQAYELCPEDNHPQPGKYTIASFSASPNIEEVRVKCLTFGKEGGLVERQYKGTKNVEYGGKIFPMDIVVVERFINGKETACEIITDEYGDKRDFYAKKCPSKNQKGFFYIDFDGQISQDFSEITSEAISKDGRIFSGVIWMDQKRGSAKTIVMGAKRIEKDGVVIFDKDFQEFASVQEISGGREKTDAIYYMGREIIRVNDNYGVRLQGIVKGKGPLFYTERYLPNNVHEYKLYLGSNVIATFGCAAPEILISPNGREYAVKFASGCDKGIGRNIIYNGQEIPNTNDAAYTDDDFGFTDDSKFYYASAENGKTYFNFNGKKYEMGSKYNWKALFQGNDFAISYSNIDNFGKGSASILFNGRLLMQTKVPPGSAYWPVDISPNGKNIIVSSGDGYFLNSQKIPGIVTMPTFLSNGKIIYSAKKIKGGETIGIYLDGKLFYTPKEGESIIANRDYTDFVIQKHIAPQNGDWRQVKVQFSYKNKPIGKVYSGFMNYAILSDDGKYLAIGYIEGNSVIKEVIKVK